MTPLGSAYGQRPAQRSAIVHVGGICHLRCALCDCASSPSQEHDLQRALTGGGARLVVRGACDESAGAADLVRRARQEGFAEIVLRTNAITSRTAEGAASFVRLGADVALVPLFSQNPAVHDRIAGHPRSLVDALAGMKNLARAGLAIEIEIPILAPSLQKLDEVVRLAHKVVPTLRAVRFFLSPMAVPPVLAPPSWDIAGSALARALLLCRELQIRAKLTSEEGIPLCALRHYPDLYTTHAFNPKARSSKRSQATFGAACERCATRPQCAGVLPAYRDANGEHGIHAYAQRPPAMYEQRTTQRRAWTEEQALAASRTQLLVLRPTVNCNQDCTFCSANETSSNVWESKEDMLRVIARAARRNIQRLSFSGGEPTLSRHLVEYIRCAARLGIEDIELVTNAVLLDRREKVAALVKAGLTHAFVSLHAHDERLSQQSTQKLGDFARTVQGVKNLVEAEVETSLNHVITIRNYPYLKEYVDFVRREFDGKVKISFAFVTPQFKALDNIEVMPRLSDVMPYFKRALYRALEIGQPFNIGSRQGIPFCFLDEFRGWSDGCNMSQAALSEDAPQKQRAPGCDECRFSQQCVGLWRPYVARYGIDELRPVLGPRLTDEDAQALREELKHLPWDLPRSFDEVPELLRERGLEQGPPHLPATPLASQESAAAFIPQRTRPLRVAMLGSGRQARRLARAAQDVVGLSIDAVASPHAPQADVHEFGNCPTYSDAAVALDDIRPEAVIIAAATNAHAELARLAIARGLPMLIEKPLASTLEQAEALRRVAHEAGAIVMMAHNSVHAGGLEEIFAIAWRHPSISYTCRRTPSSSDAMRTWNRSNLYETAYHLLAVVGRLSGGGVGEVTKVVYTGESYPERLRVNLAYAAGNAEITLDFTGSVEEDVLTCTESAAPDKHTTWRRQGRSLTLSDREGTRTLEARGSDVERMLASFRDFVLGKAPPTATIDEAIDIMVTARRVVEAAAAAGVPFERPQAPRHHASRALETPFA